MRDNRLFTHCVLGFLCFLSYTRHCWCDASLNIKLIGESRLCVTNEDVILNDAVLLGETAYFALNQGLYCVDVQADETSFNTSPPTLVSGAGNILAFEEAGSELYIMRTNGFEIWGWGEGTPPTRNGWFTKPGAWKSAKDMVVSGTTTYVLHDFGLDVLDISDPRQPSAVSSFRLEPRMGMQKLETYGNLVFIGGEHPGVMVLDVSDRIQPKEIGGFGIGGTCVGIDRVGNLLVAGSIHQGIFFFDLRSMEPPVFQGRFASTGQPRNLLLSGNHLYISNNGDLDVVDVSSPQNPVWRGWYMLKDGERAAPQPGLVLGSTVLCVDHRGYLLALQFTGIHPPRKQMPPSDLTHDGKVDAHDLLLLQADWQQGRQ